MDSQNFFDDESEVSTHHGSSDDKKLDAQKGAQNSAPSFASVIVIALVALVLGIVIGYVFGKSSNPEPAPQVPQEMPQPQNTQTAPPLDTDVLEGGELPEGHPDISEMMREKNQAEPSNEAGAAQ